MKNIIKKILFLTLAFGLFAFSCEDDYPEFFNIKNNSSKVIYYGLSYSQTDFSLKGIDFAPGVNGNKSHKITPGGNNLARVGSSIMQVYIFDADVIENTSWDYYCKIQYVLKTVSVYRCGVRKYEL